MKFIHDKPMMMILTVSARRTLAPMAAWAHMSIPGPDGTWKRIVPQEADDETPSSSSSRVDDDDVFFLCEGWTKALSHEQVLATSALCCSSGYGSEAGISRVVTGFPPPALVGCTNTRSSPRCQDESLSDDADDDDDGRFCCEEVSDEEKGEERQKEEPRCLSTCGLHPQKGLCFVETRTDSDIIVRAACGRVLMEMMRRRWFEGVEPDDAVTALDPLKPAAAAARARTHALPIFAILKALGGLSSLNALYLATCCFNPHGACACLDVQYSYNHHDPPRESPAPAMTRVARIHVRYRYDTPAARQHGSN